MGGAGARKVRDACDDGKPSNGGGVLYGKGPVEHINIFCTRAQQRRAKREVARCSRWRCVTARGGARPSFAACRVCPRPPSRAEARTDTVQARLHF